MKKKLSLPPRNITLIILISDAKKELIALGKKS